MVFDPVKEGGVELFDPIAEGGIALEEPLEEPLEPKVAFDRAGEIWDISVDLQIPLSDAEENYNKIVSKKPDTPKPSDDLGSIVSRPLTKPEIEEEKTLQEEIERAAFLQKHPQLLRQLQRQQEDQLIQDYFNSLPDSALKLDGWHRKVHLAKAKRFQIEKLRGEGKIPDERRVYTGFWNELGRNTVGGSLNVASGLIGTLASASEGAIWDKDKLEEWANSIHKLSSKPAFTASKEGGWKGFVAASVGQAFPYMAASTAAVITTGQPYAAFAVGFSVEGDNAYRTALANGASEEEAQLNRFVVGTINGAIEQLQVSQLLKFAKVGSGSIKAISKAAQDRAMKKILAAGSKLTLNSLHHFSREALEETLQEFTSIAAEAEQNPDAWLFATDRILKAGLGGGVVGLLLGTGGAMRTQTQTAEEAKKPAVAKPTAKPTVAPAAEVTAAKLKKTESVTKPERDILGGVDPLLTIQRALKEAKAVQPKTKSEKAVELRRRVGAAAGAMKSNVKKGVPAEEAIFKSTGLLKGPLTEYDQLYTSIEDILEPGAKEAAYAKIYKHPDLQYFEILNTATSFKKLLAGTGLTPGDVKNIENIFGKTFEEFTKPRTTRSGLYELAITLWKAGLLTGIKTSGLNILSTYTHSVTETAKDIPAAGVDSIASLFTGKRALAFTTRGVPSGVKEGAIRGWRYLRTGYDERNIGAKLDYKAVHFGNSKIAKGLQVYEETIFHLLGAEDQPFYYGAKARSLFSQAIAKAKNKKLKGKEKDVFVENLVKNPTDDMLIAATHDAEVAVFQNKTLFGDIAKAVQKSKVGEVIVPFGRTPSAVATQIINYSPVGIVKEVAQQIHDGEFNQRKVSQAFGRTALGTGALFIGGVLLKAGLITLDRPKTERERKLWELEGRKANSVKIGGKWRSIQVLGPVGNVLIIGGHFQQELQKTGSPTKAIVKAFTGGGKSFSEQTFVRGMSSAIDALVSPETSFENWFSSMAGSAVPTIVADIARAFDEIERRTEGPAQRVQIRVPGLREKLPPKIDVFGQDLPRYGGNVLETMIDPSRPSKIKQDVVVDELRRLFDKDIKVTPTLLGDKMGFDILTTEENTQLWRRSGELTYKTLQAWIESDEYKKIDNDFAKGKTIEVIVSKTKAAAKAEMVSIKLSQGVSVIELAESGLLTIEGLEALKYFGESKQLTKKE